MNADFDIGLVSVGHRRAAPSANGGLYSPGCEMRRAVSMKFTEYEMTAAVDAVARRLFAAGRAPWGRGGVEEAWRSLPAIDKYKRKSMAGELVLPILHALPERPTVGARPQFNNDEYAAAAEQASRAQLEYRSPGAWDELPARRRRRLVRTSVALTRTAVRAMPVRQEPDENVELQ